MMTHDQLNEIASGKISIENQLRAELILSVRDVAGQLRVCRDELSQIRESIQTIRMIQERK